MTNHDVPRTRLADLAEHSGVSTATVSRVLNRKPGVAESTRQAVYHALDLLGYERPRRITSPSAGLIGLVIPELSNPVFPAFAQAIETALGVLRRAPADSSPRLDGRALSDSHTRHAQVFQSAVRREQRDDGS